MTTIYDVDPNELIEKAAQELKNIPDIKPPVWADYVKTGIHKKRPPVKRDWWYVRVAAILRSIDKLGPVGVSKLRVKYGGKVDNGVAPEHHRKGSGSIIRKALQQLEKSGFAKQEDKQGHKGRVITPKGISFFEKIASSIAKDRPKIKYGGTEDDKIPSEEPKKEVKEKRKKVKEAPKAEEQKNE